jgi:hypothetical protein
MCPYSSLFILNTHLDDNKFQEWLMGTIRQVPLAKNAAFSSSMAACHLVASGRRMASA